MQLRDFPHVTRAIWAVLLVALALALITGRWSLAFVSLATLVLTLLPVLFVERFQVRLPFSFVGAISVFVFATIFLGEAFDFYGRYWWWDLFLHGGSAIGFGLIGFLFVFAMFEGDQYAAPPVAVALMAFCFAMTIGATWEIFEFAMDELFGFNMQKTGLYDTMGDLMINAAGATLGAGTGFFWLKGQQLGGLSGVISEFLRLNKGFFRKLRR
ncbi:MAG: hypothetical protein HKO95_08155 [Rhodobacteraceae bacterium]|nr:hypothetical protein [Alphaproteobacteria bacterium]NNF71265.1 hypothetical protein [Paracoccaceae bacterium]NNK66695.1 hypothetical protein [Paracoccaceae bacterium]